MSAEQTNQAVNRLVLAIQQAKAAVQAVPGQIPQALCEGSVEVAACQKQLAACEDNYQRALEQLQHAVRLAEINWFTKEVSHGSASNLN